MRHDLLPEPAHGAIPAHLARAFLKDILVIAGTLVLAILVMLSVLAFSGLPARAEASIDGGADSPAGLYFRTGSADTALEAPTLSSDVRMQVNGMVNRVTVRQVFHNPTDRWQEGIYVFPLPERSAVDSLSMIIGERRVQGRILEKAAAERVYREAADSGRRASLVSGERPNVFVTSLANIGPGENITVEIGYQDAVAYDDGLFSLRFPMVVAPRYSPAPPAEIAEAPVPPGPAFDPAVIRRIEEQPRDLFGPVDIDPETANKLSLRIELDSGLPLASLRSLYHPVAVDSLEDGRQIVSLKAGAVPADRDFVLEWSAKPSDKPQAAVFAEQVGADTHLLVMMLPPSPDDSATRDVRPRELILVIDTSGSMHGDSIDQAKAAVIAALKRLRPEDRFNVIQFNNRTLALFPRAVAATAGNVAMAWRYVSALEAEGGTEMRPALELALAPAAPEGTLRQVVFLTDAAVSNEAELFKQVAARLGDSRLFTVGIGTAPNSYFMRKAAELGRGTFTYIGDLGEVEPRVGALLRQLEQPALTDLRVGWPLTAGKRIEAYPTPLPDLYAGEPVTFSARLEGVAMNALAGKLLVSGQDGDGIWQQRLDLGRLRPAPGSAAIWARAKIAQIEDGLYRSGDRVDATAVRAAALGVALEHRLVTRYTSLVAVDDEVARPEDAALDSREIPRDLPRGWEAETVFGSQESRAAPGATALDSNSAPMELRRRALPAPLMQATGSARGQAVTLPQTATPAERMAILGGAYLTLGFLLVLLVLYRARKVRLCA
ncbi:MAG: marine proteobacterial sortase target protein [Kiloniellaceae bacterium]